MNGVGASSRAAATGIGLARRTAKRLLRWASGALAVVLVLLALLVLFRDAFFKAFIICRIREQLGLRAEIGELKTGLGSTVIHLRDFKLFNTPEFGGTLLADAPELLAQVDTEPLADRMIRFKQLRFNLAEFNVVRNGNGRTNLEKMEKAWREHLRRKREKKRSVRWDFGGIDQLQVSVGKVSFTDLHKPALSREFRLDLRDEEGRDLKDEELVQNWVALLVVRLLAEDSLRDKKDRRLPSLDWLIGWTAN
jgi:uncharacterized protein involved in outer membrane biogenesis